MSLQIFCGKGFDTQKAERFFKERRISYQKIDTLKYGISRRELESVERAVGLQNLCDRDTQAFRESTVAYTQDRDRILDGLLEHPNLLKLPIVRSGKNATVGYAPDTWTQWIQNKQI